MYNLLSTMKAKNQSVSSDAEAKERLIVYVYEYLIHIGAKQSAQTFLDEIQYGREVHASEGPGFLTNWWLVFWDLYCAASDKKPNQAEPSSEAKAFHEYNSHSRPSISSPAGPPPVPPPQGAGGPADHHQMAGMGGPPQGGPQPMPPGQPTAFMPRYGPPPPPNQQQQQMRPGPGTPIQHAGPPQMTDQYGQPSGPPGRPPGGPGMPGGPGGPMMGPGPGGPMPGGPVQAGSPMPVGPGGPPPNMMPNNMDAMGRSPGYRSPLSVGPQPRPPHPMSPMNPGGYQMMRPQNSMGGGAGGGNPNAGGAAGGASWDDYSMPQYGQENDQIDTAEILKVKQNLQEDVKKLTKEQEDYGGFMP